MKGKYLAGLAVLLFLVCAWPMFQHLIPRQTIPVLMYHNLAPKIKDSVTVDPVDFKEQMLCLKNAGYTFLTAEDLAAVMHNKKALPRKPVLITFDDGYLSNYQYAYPILKELGLKGTIFVIAGQCGQTPGHLSHFTWKQAKEMYDAGVMDIQSHSFNSHFSIEKKTLSGKWSRVPALITRLLVHGKPETTRQYKERVTTDLQESRRVIEKQVGDKVVALAYPFGAQTLILRYLAKVSGFEIGFVIKDRVNYLSDNPFLLQRINVSGTYSGQDLLSFIEHPEKIPRTRVSLAKKIRHKLGDELMSLYHIYEYMSVRIS